MQIIVRLNTALTATAERQLSVCRLSFCLPCLFAVPVDTTRNFTKTKFSGFFKDRNKSCLKYLKTNLVLTKFFYVYISFLLFSDTGQNCSGLTCFYTRIKQAKKP